MLTLALAAIALPLASGCTAPPQRAAAVDHPDLLVLVIDALRPDHLGCYGYPRATSPTLDALAARGTLFERAQSAANYTTASVPSIFTGLYPSVHGVFSEGDRLSDAALTLAERLQDIGYATAAFAPNPSLGRRFNFDQGFDLYDDKALRNDEVPPWRHFETADRIQAGALRFLDEHADRPVFLYLHYRDVHGPYVPPPPYDRLFWNGSAAAGTAARPLSAEEIAARPDYLDLEGAPERLDYYMAQYDGEIRYTDDRIASLLAALERRGRLSRSWIVVTADHGEAFLDHGAWNHGNELYQEEVHVPLILVAPDGRGAGRRDPAPVSGVDLLPTLLSAAGAPSPTGLQGRSLLSRLSGSSPAPATIFSEGRNRVAVLAGRHKLLRDAGAERWRLFDLAADPRERDDLAAVASATRAELERESPRFLAASRRLAAPFPRARVEIDGTLERELRALGYLR